MKAAWADAGFWRLLEARGTPLVEPLAGAPADVMVTFFFRHATARHVLVMKGPEEPRAAMLERVPGTDIWARSYRLPAEARFQYSFAPDFPLDPPPIEQIETLERRMSADPLNPRRIGLFSSLCELPAAPSSRWTTPSREIPTGAVSAHKVTSRRLGNARRIYVYTPPGYSDARGPYPLAVLFDGLDYLSGIPTATILDNLIAQGRLPPTVALLVDPVDRIGELGLDASFGDVVARALVPFVQQRYRASTDPRAVVVGGFSLGGLAAVWTAFRHPDVFGNVLAQSDARMPRPDGLDVYEWLARQVEATPALPIRFHLEEGNLRRPEALDAATLPFRHLQPVLTAKGYSFTVRPFVGGHHTSSWRVRLGDALVALLADARPRTALSAATPAAPTDDVTVEDLGPSLAAAVLRAAVLARTEGVDSADAAVRTFRDASAGSRDLDEPMLDALAVEMLYTAGLPAAALAICDERLRRFPSSADAHNALAAVRYVAGDRAAALAACQASLSLDPAHVGARNLLERLTSH